MMHTPDRFFRIGNWLLGGTLAVCGPSLAGTAEPVAPLALTSARQLDTGALAAASQMERVREGLYKALREHPEVQGAQASFQSKTYEADAARYARYPRFQVGSGVGSTDGAAPGQSSSYQVLSLSARMTLIDGGAIGARIEAADATSEAFEAAVRSTSQKVALDAMTAYMQVLRHERKREVAQRAVAALDELVRLERRRVELGATGESDLQLARSRRGAFAARQQEFESQLVEAQAKFENYFGFQPDASRLPAIAVPAWWTPASQVELVRVSEALSAELAEARGRIESARAQVRQHEAAWFPSVDLVVARTRDPRGVVYSDATRSGVELNWNFGNGFDRNLRIKGALAEVANQEAKFESARMNLQQLTTTAWGQSRSSGHKVRELGEALRESEQLVQGRQRMLSFGRTTLISVLDARVEYETQRLDWVDAQMDLRVHELRIARVTGRLLLDARSGSTWVEELLAAPRSGVAPAGAIDLPAGTRHPDRPEPGIRLQASMDLRS